MAGKGVKCASAILTAAVRVLSRIPFPSGMECVLISSHGVKILVPAILYFQPDFDYVTTMADFFIAEYVVSVKTVQLVGYAHVKKK